MLISVLLVSLLAGSALAVEIDEGDLEYLWEEVNVTDPAVELSGRWLEVDDEEAVGELEVTTMRAAAYAEFTFEGSGVRWIGSTGINRGQADIYLNDELIAETVDAYRPDGERGAVIFEIYNLEDGTHTLRVDPTGEAHEDATLANVNIDAFAYIPTLESAVNRARETMEKAPIGEPGMYQFVGDDVQLVYYPEENKEDVMASIESSQAVLDDEEADADARYAALLNLQKSMGVFREAAVMEMVHEGTNLEVIAPRVEQGPEIDGSLHDDAWLQASIRGGKVVQDMCTEGVRLSDYPRVVYVCYDDEALYVMYVIFAPEIDRLQTSAANPWENDEVELFLEPAGQEYFQICVDAGEQLHISEEKPEEVEYAVYLGESTWRVEIAVPFEEIGVTPQPGDKWGIGLCGRQIAVGDMWLTWNPTFGGFHNPERFGTLIFYP